MQDAANAWLTWYDTIFTEPAGASDDAWIPSRFEYAMSGATHLSAAAADEVTFTTKEHDGGHLDWSSFDLSVDAKIATLGDDAVKSRVEAAVPAPVTFAARRRRGSGSWRTRASRTVCSRSVRPISCSS